MKKPILFFVLFIFSALTSIHATNVSLTRNNTTSTPIRPRAPMLIPVTVDFSGTDLYFNFTNSVGLATITVTDSNGAIVAQELVDTTTTDELLIPLEGYEIGDYTITISYGSIQLGGAFTME